VENLSTLNKSIGYGRKICGNICLKTGSLLKSLEKDRLFNRFHRPSRPPFVKKWKRTERALFLQGLDNSISQLVVEKL
jgi:hypothetical protein